MTTSGGVPGSHGPVDNPHDALSRRPEPTAPASGERLGTPPRRGVRRVFTGSPARRTLAALLTALALSGTSVLAWRAVVAQPRYVLATIAAIAVFSVVAATGARYAASRRGRPGASDGQR